MLSPMRHFDRGGSRDETGDAEESCRKKKARVLTRAAYRPDRPGQVGSQPPTLVQCIHQMSVIVALVAQICTLPFRGCRLAQALSSLYHSRTEEKR